MTPVEQSNSLVTAYLARDEVISEMLLAETQDPMLVSALTTLTGSFIRQLASTVGIEPDELWRRTLCSYKAKTPD